MLMKLENITHDEGLTSTRPISSHLNVGQWLKTLKTWRQRSRQRRALAMLDEDLLDDIGITRHDVRREISKSFWL